jgi:predicted RNA-binding protein YlqC (UPF0109 family)
MSIATYLRVSPDALPGLRALLVSSDEDEAAKKINEGDEFGDTPLHIAAAAGKLLTVKYLVNNSANVNAKNEAGSTPLHKAMLSGSTGKPIVEFLLLEKKAEWTTNNSGLTPFSYARDILRDQKQFFFTLIEKETKKPASTTIKVSSNALPIIIGKGGKMLENIRVEAQTDVEVPDRRSRNPNEDQVEITLTARNEKDLEQGKKKIEKLIEKQEQEKKRKEEEVVKSKEAPQQGKEAAKPVKKEPEDYNVRKKEPAGKKKKNAPPGDESKQGVGKIVSDIALSQATAETTMKERNVRIPKDKHGLVIGKKGANIERIKTTYGVSVIVPDHNDESDIIRIKGTSKEALEDAKYDILQLLRGPGGGAGGTGGRGRGGRGGGGNRPSGPGGSGGNRRYGREEDQAEKKAPAKPKVPQKINLDDAKDWPAFG